MINTFKRNLSNYTVISDKDIAKINKNIEEQMKPIIREYDRSQYIINKKYNLFK